MSRRAASWAVGISAAGGVVAALLFFAVPALACSCTFVMGEAVSPEAAVFTGVASNVSISHPGAPMTYSSADPVEVLFDVELVYRGSVAGRTTVHTVASSVSCGFEFQQGRRYTVFAWTQEGKLTTGMCSGTVAGGIDPVAFRLGEGVPPGQAAANPPAPRAAEPAAPQAPGTPVASRPARPADGPTIWSTRVLALALLAGGAAIWGWLRVRRVSRPL